MNEQSNTIENKILDVRARGGIQNVRTVLIVSGSKNILHLLLPGACGTWPPIAYNPPVGWKVGRCDFGEDDEEALIVGWKGEPVLEGLFRLWQAWVGAKKPAPFPLDWGHDLEGNHRLDAIVYWSRGVCKELGYRAIFLDDNGNEIGVEVVED